MEDMGKEIMRGNFHNVDLKVAWLQERYLASEKDVQHNETSKRSSIYVFVL